MYKAITLLFLFSVLLFAEPFQLDFDFSQYNDTIVGFSYSGHGEPVVQAGIYSCEEWTSELYDYEIRNIGFIESWGPISVMQCTAPSHPMYLSKTYALITKAQNSSQTTTYRHKDSLGNDKEYSDIFDYGYGEFYYNMSYSLDSTQSALHKNYFDIIPIEQEEINIGEGDMFCPESDYCAFITNEQGGTLRLEIFLEFEISEWDIKYISDARLRISSDSAGNGKFQIDDTPILEHQQKRPEEQRIAVSNNLLNFSSGMYGKSVSIRNCRGQEVDRFVISTEQYTIPALPTGIYLLSVGKSSLFSQKLFVK